MSYSLPDPARLAAAAASAAEIRALALDPAVIALRVERIRAQVDTCSWVAIGLGLAFTAVNVQTFGAAGAPTGSPEWLVAWLLDPMVSLLLIAVLRAEQVTARWQVATGWRVTAAKWGCFAATYAMNTWASWTAGAPSGVVLHSVPPLVVLLGAEVAPELRDRLTAAVTTAAHAEARAGSQAAVTYQREDGGTYLPDEAVPPADDPGQDRTAALAVPPIAGPRAGRTRDPAGDLPNVDDEASHLEPPTVAVGGHPDPRPALGRGDTGFDGLGEVDGRRDVTDPRVAVLAELLVAGASVTGAQAAALYEVSDRQGRRLLRDARERASTAAPAGSSPGSAAGRSPARSVAVPWGQLRVVPGEGGQR